MIPENFNCSGNFAQIRILRMRKCENAKEIFTMRMRSECDDFWKSRCECEAKANLSLRIRIFSQNAKIAMRIYIPGRPLFSPVEFVFYQTRGPSGGPSVSELLEYATVSSKFITYLYITLSSTIWYSTIGIALILTTLDATRFALLFREGLPSIGFVHTL